MISFTLDDLQPLLDGSASPLLLFQGETLLKINQAAVLSWDNIRQSACRPVIRRCLARFSL